MTDGETLRLETQQAVGKHITVSCCICDIRPSSDQSEMVCSTCCVMPVVFVAW